LTITHPETKGILSSLVTRFWPGEQHRPFFDPKHPNRLSAHPTANPTHSGALTVALKQPERETVHSLPFSAEIMH